MKFAPEFWFSVIDPLVVLPLVVLPVEKDC